MLYVIVSGVRGRGREKKTWEECVKLDLKLCGLINEAAMDRNAVERLNFWEPSDPC